MANENALMGWSPTVVAESAEDEGSPFRRRPQSAMNALSDGYLAMMTGGLGRAAFSKPTPGMELYAFIGPSGARRLQEAGRIAPGAPGSKEALQVAQDIWRKHGMGSPELQDRVWKATGWGHPETFGGVAPGSKPMTWVDTSTTTLKPEIWQALDPALASGKSGAKTGRLGDLVELPADLRTAQPALASKTASAEANNGGHGQVASRNDGTMSEYVIEILRRYGLAGLMAGGAAASARPSQDTQ
jgi:hypothetical protein